MSKVIEKLPNKPAKPLNGMILVKRTVAQDPDAKKKEKKRPEEREPFETPFITEIHDIGINKPEDLPFKVGDKVNVITYGSEIITAEEVDDKVDICYIILEPSKVVGLYE